MEREKKDKGNTTLLNATKSEQGQKKDLDDKKKAETKTRRKECGRLCIVKKGNGANTK